jgi:hypothetical protein
MESLRFDAHELLIIHLPRHVLVYDASSSANGPQWCVLKTGLYDDVYRAIDFIYEGNQITCGDKLESVTGKLQFDISSQYDKQQEHLLFTPLFKADNARCFDLEVESSTGVAQYADRLFLSATTDGINYGREQMIEQNEPFVYDKRRYYCAGSGQQLYASDTNASSSCRAIAVHRNGYSANYRCVAT